MDTYSFATSFGETTTQTFQSLALRDLSILSLTIISLKHLHKIMILPTVG